MINVVVEKNNQDIKSIEVSGHSGYDELGKDIVCSAVSTAMYLTVGLLEKFNCIMTFTSDESIPNMNLKILNINESTNLILENLVKTLKGIEMDFSPYLKIKIRGGKLSC